MTKRMDELKPNDECLNNCTAKRVQVTPDVMAAARGAFEDHYGGSVRPIIEAAFRAAGFEIEH